MAIFQDTLIFISVAVPPIIFGILLFFGLNINEREERQDRRVRMDSHQKHPFAPPLEGDQNG
jgi:hypothetical protein